MSTIASIAAAAADHEETEESKMMVSQQYQRKTDVQHILENQEMYIGSIDKIDSMQWVFDESTQRIVLRNIVLVPGLQKLFDEAIVNCRDHVKRMITKIGELKKGDGGVVTEKYVTYIDVTIDETLGKITMTNNGTGIPVLKHHELEVWIPELIFAQLRTSSNYDKSEEKIVGGKNGFGAKLISIWSTWAAIETVDHVRGLHYYQEFRNNLSEITAPTITKLAAKAEGRKDPYTRFSFIPDYARMHLLPEKLSACAPTTRDDGDGCGESRGSGGSGSGGGTEMLALMKKRVYDIAAITDHSAKKIRVSFNGEVVPVKNFLSYIDLYIGSKDETKRVYEDGGERWEYAVALSPTHQFENISFVNGIATTKGGKHVDYIIGQIARKLVVLIKDKKKKVVSVPAVKEQLILFLRCDIVNPAFDSQSKDFLTTPSSLFGSVCNVSDGFIEKVAKMGVIDAACSITDAKDLSRNAKKTNGSKIKSIRGIENLVDANLSGTKDSDKCKLYICEGCSALSGILSGLNAADRDYIGIYPLKGKVLNVRGEVASKVANNKEITELKKILGLEIGRDYATLGEVHAQLRYSQVIILTDQDLDGSHIKGLIINLFHCEWPSLLKLDGFLSYMNTPILRAKRAGAGAGTAEEAYLNFYNEGEYVEWKKRMSPEDLQKKWTIKYFKGLGTSTSRDFKDYFANKKIVNFTGHVLPRAAAATDMETDEDLDTDMQIVSSSSSAPAPAPASTWNKKNDDSIDKVFNKKRADDRKRWLGQYDRDVDLDTSLDKVSYEDFIDKNIIHFSKYDCERSIPNLVDGLKISLRKILFCAFMRNLVKEIKVAQFTGYVSEHSHYHHGEMSLKGAIVNMAQTFVGSNNINLLEPNGQFGTRLQGGSDSASERYIFTALNPLTRTIFSAHDDSILDYRTDDGASVEPEFYTPIIPMVLVNGMSGIGTGFSCTIPPFNPLDIVHYLQVQLSGAGAGAPLPSFVPYYEGFKGVVAPIAGETQKFRVTGCYRKIKEDTIEITELPIGTWTMTYITFLEGLMDGNVDKTTGAKLPSLIKDFSSNSTELNVSIVVTFHKGDLDKYEAKGDAAAPTEGVAKLLKLGTTVSITNMHLFDEKQNLRLFRSVEEIIDAFIPVRLSFYEKRKAMLLEKGGDKIIKLTNRVRFLRGNIAGEIDLRGKKKADIELMLRDTFRFDLIHGDFTYLTNMHMDSVCIETVEAFQKEERAVRDDLERLKSTTSAEMWMRELAEFEQEYRTYKHKRQLQTNHHTQPPSATNDKKLKRKNK